MRQALWGRASPPAQAQDKVAGVLVVAAGVLVVAAGVLVVAVAEMVAGLGSIGNSRTEALQPLDDPGGRVRGTRADGGRREAAPARRGPFSAGCEMRSCASG